MTLELIKKDIPSVKLGGRLRPKDREALQKVAIIILFHKQDKHLTYWLLYLHPILPRQQLAHGFYNINRGEDEIFNIYYLKEYDLKW